FRVFESVIPSGDHDNHLKEFSKNPNKGYYKHALIERKVYICNFGFFLSVPRWLSLVERPLGKRQVAGSNPARGSNKMLF
ncbi:MAG: hypothetical protein PWQ32_1287, partial [Thermococcaceae archaeon]|nr:hypothetical protein [Thermococcaceae archaeon]